MRRGILAASALILIVLLLAMTGCGDGSATQTASTAAGLADQAKSEMQQGNLSLATDLYEQAAEFYNSEGDTARARECSSGIQNAGIIKMTYAWSEDELRGKLAEAFPDVPEDQREAWIASDELEHLVIDGEPMYCSDVITNLKFRNVDLFRQDAAMLAGYETVYSLLKGMVDQPLDPSWQPYTNPITCQATHLIDIPRDQLPNEGLLKIWFPLPLITGPQPSVRVTSIEPGTYVVEPPSIDGDIGVVYMEVPLDQLVGDLSLRVRFEFEHYEQRFAVDPARVGAYDTDSALYQEYTASSPNIAVTPEIEETARRVVGDEVNPYLAAKKIYDYILENIKYSLVPHPALPQLGIPEAVYVHEHRCGDCGAQSMYFSALCRAVGIPARTTGGWQFLKGTFGDHFWAEFYLPGYGWVPVDPTVAEMADYIPNLSGDEVKAFHDLCFANMDNLRCVVQHDIDVPLVPAVLEPTLFVPGFQTPLFNCDTMQELPDLVLHQYWSRDVQISGR
jgi:transglutaminase-like putative cysteine protease